MEESLFHKRRKLTHPMNADRKAAAFANRATQASDLFQMQITELLEGVKPNLKRRLSKLENFLQSLKDRIEGLPSREPVPVSVAERRLWIDHNVKVPFPVPRPPKDAKYLFAYDKPTKIDVVGHTALNLAVRGEEPLVIDLAVMMPSKLFEQKDYLNHRYFYKRAYYLACIAAGLNGHKDQKWSYTFSCQNDNALQPSLIVFSSENTTSDSRSSRCYIQILLTASNDIFPLGKLLPWKVCIRQTSQSALKSESHAAPTPFYNATLKSNICTTAFHKFLYSAQARFEQLTDASIMTTIWLRQRGLGSKLSEGGFGTFESVVLIAWLLQGGGLQDKALFSAGYSSSQLFRALLQFLDTKDLVKEPFVLQHEVKYDLKQFKSFGPTFFDGVRGVNLLFKMTLWSYRKLRHEARVTLQSLSKPTFDRLTPTFINKVDDPWLQFDSLFSITLPALDFSDVKNIDNNFYDSGVHRRLYTILETALADRISLLTFNQESCKPWKASEIQCSSKSPLVVYVGVLVNPEMVDRVVDHGPSAENKQAAATFRQFWGEKAELRRFKDGSILESLIWTNEGQGRSILQQVIAHSIRRHLGSEIAESIEFLDRDLAFMSAPLVSALRLSNTQPSAWQAFEQIQGLIRSLEGLPLIVRQLSLASSGSLNTSCWVDGGDYTISKRPMDIVLQFEGSARWPDDISAIQKTKVAFLLKLGELLEEADDSLETQLGLENETNPFLNNAFLNIRLSTTSFHLRIHHDRELTLLNRMLKSPATSPYPQESLALAISKYKRTYLQTPTHTQSIRGLCTRFSILSSTICLMKRWVSSHLLYTHFPEELIEIFTVRSFTHPYPYTVPGSVQAAFLRTLAMLANWDWHSEPLIVETTREVSDAEVEAINLRFEGWRKIDPAMNRIALFVATSLDQEGTVWTDRRPSKLVAARLCSLAKAACRVVKSQDVRTFDAATIFVSSLAEYDFVVRLARRLGKEASFGAKSAFKNIQLASRAKNPWAPDFFQLLLKELENLFGNNISFFCDSEKGLIAGLWNPDATARSWKINSTYSTMPEGNLTEENGEHKVRINKVAILNDIARLGGVLISKIEIINHS